MADIGEWSWAGYRQGNFVKKIIGLWRVFHALYGSPAHYFLEDNKDAWEKSGRPSILVDRCSFLYAFKACICHSVRGPPAPQFTGKREKRLEAKGWRKNILIPYRTDLRHIWWPLSGTHGRHIGNGSNGCRAWRPPGRISWSGTIRILRSSTGPT